MLFLTWKFCNGFSIALKIKIKNKLGVISPSINKPQLSSPQYSPTLPANTLRSNHIELPSVLKSDMFSIALDFYTSLSLFLVHSSLIWEDFIHKFSHYLYISS